MDTAPTGPGWSTRATTPPGPATKIPAAAAGESSVAAKAIAPPSAIEALARAPNVPWSGAGNGSPVFATTESTPPSSRRIPLVVARSATWPALDATGRRNPSRRSPSAVASPERKDLRRCRGGDSLRDEQRREQCVARAHALRPPPRRGVDRVDHAHVLDRIRRPGRDWCAVAHGGDERAQLALVGRRAGDALAARARGRQHA